MNWNSFEPERALCTLLSSDVSMNNVITKSVAIKEIMNVEAVNLLDIDEHNVDEVIDMELEMA